MESIAVPTKKICFFIVFLLLCLFVADASHAETLQGQTVVSQILGQFHSKLANYEQVMLKAARQLFYWCAILEIAYLGWKAALGATDIGTIFKNFCLSLVTAGFFLAVIHNYHEWAWNVINGLQKIAGEATTLLDASDEPFSAGLELAKALFDKTVNDAKTRFYNYARLAGQEEKIRQRLEGKKDSPVEDKKATVRREKKERVVDPEREARRLQRRAERKARREAQNEEKSE